MSANVENSEGGHKAGKGQFSFQSQRKAMTKNAQTTSQLHSSHASKVMLKIRQARALRVHEPRTSRYTNWI